MAKTSSALWMIGGGLAAWLLLPMLLKKEDESELIPSLDISGLLPNLSGIDFGSLLPNLGEMDFNKLLPDIGGMDFSGLIPDFSGLFAALNEALAGLIPGGGGGGDGGLTFPLIGQLGQDWGSGVGKISDIWSQIVSGPRAYYEGWIDFWYRQTIGPGLEAGQAETMSEMYAAAQAKLSPAQFELFMARERGEISGPEYVAALQQLLASLNENLAGLSTMGAEAPTLPESGPTPTPFFPTQPVSEGGQWHQVGSAEYYVFSATQMAQISPAILAQYYAGTSHIPEGYQVTPQAVTAPGGEVVQTQSQYEQRWG